MTVGLFVLYGSLCISAGYERKDVEYGEYMVCVFSQLR
ncbi:hypothetical protein UF75_2114 [Desulfosporosinus sp. I2]|nr:hypothetical protein UF75_2114 [Desulfosporosinus sp. I2]